MPAGKTFDAPISTLECDSHPKSSTIRRSSFSRGPIAESCLEYRPETRHRQDGRAVVYGPKLEADGPDSTTNTSG